MSYILEALKKSDQERQQKQIPGLQTNHAPSYPGARRVRVKKRSPIAFRLITGLFLIAIGGFLFSFSYMSPYSLRLNVTINEEPVNQPYEQVAEAPAIGETVDNVANVPLITRPEEQALPITVQVPQTKIQATVISPVPPAAEKTQEATPAEEIIYQPAPLIAEDVPLEHAIEIPTTQLDLPFQSELPAELRATLPELAYAGHAYSIRPDERMIIINNSIKREGENIAQDLRLIEITWEGVVLKYKGVKFQVATTR